MQVRLNTRKSLHHNKDPKIKKDELCVTMGQNDVDEVSKIFKLSC